MFKDSDLIPVFYDYDDASQNINRDDNDNNSDDSDDLDSESEDNIDKEIFRDKISDINEDDQEPPINNKITITMIETKI